MEIQRIHESSSGAWLERGDVNVENTRKLAATAYYSKKFDMSSASIGGSYACAHV